MCTNISLHVGRMRDWHLLRDCCDIDVINNLRRRYVTYDVIGDVRYQDGGIRRGTDQSVNHMTDKLLAAITSKLV